MPNEAIELRVKEIAQIFHTLDPYPFRERDLDQEVEEFIVGWARELPSDQPIRIIVHFPDTEKQVRAARYLAEAFSHYFAYQADNVQRELKQLFRIGRVSLGIGITILVICFTAARLAEEFLTGTPLRLVEESFLILGWVANWRPIEIFLYEWWPLVRRRNLYRRLAGAEVEAKPYPPTEHPMS